MTKEVITELEKQTGIVAIKAASLKGIKTAEDLQAAAVEQPLDFAQIIVDTRIEFLETNGYKVTRKNLADPNLSAKRSK